MPSNRRLARIAAFQIIYEYSFSQSFLKDEPAYGDNFYNLDKIIKRTIEVHDIATENQDFIRNLVDYTISNQEKIDELITKYAPQWPIKQIASCDLEVLRLAIAELLFNPDSPRKVIINEAVELGRLFGGDNSSKFINGVLGSIYQEVEDDGKNQ